MPVEMPRRRFEELVAEALDEVPPEFARAMDNVVVLVEEYNEETPDAPRPCMPPPGKESGPDDRLMAV